MPKLKLDENGLPNTTDVRRALRTRRDPDRTLTATPLARNAAGLALAEQAADLAFTTSKPFDECVRQAARKSPALLELWAARADSKHGEVDAIPPQEDAE